MNVCECVCVCGVCVSVSVCVNVCWPGVSIMGGLAYGPMICYPSEAAL